MKRATIFGACAVCVALTAACGRHQPQASDARPQPVDIRGCLTASGDQFVLTQLQDASAASNPTTDIFQLTKTADQPIDLKQYVGKEVRVAGEADPPRVAEVREGDAATPAATTGQGQAPAAAATGKGPKVGTTEDERFAYRKLAVSSVTPTGDACPAANTPTPGR